VEFEERNLSTNPEYAAELRALGSLATPTTQIGDQVIIGFDREQLQRALAEPV